jgi:PAS domain S-box-containing protein
LATKFVDYDLMGDALAVAQNGSQIETEIQHAEGSSYKLHIMPYYTQEGASDGVIATFSDMTRLRRAEKQLAAIVESSSDAIFSKTSDGIILTWNSAASRMYGYSAQEAIGQNVSLLVPPYRLAEVDEILERIRSGKRVSSFETERVAKDGRTFHVSLAVSPIKDASGRIASISVIARDITDKWESLQALKKSEERFRTLVESSPNAILLTASDGTITQLNSQAQAMFGYSPDELLRKPIEILIPERFRSHHPAFRAQFNAEPRQRPMGAGRDLFAIRKDGSEFPVEIGLTPLQMPEGMVTMATIIDITERKRLAGSSSGSI